MHVAKNYRYISIQFQTHICIQYTCDGSYTLDAETLISGLVFTEDLNRIVEPECKDQLQSNIPLLQSNDRGMLDCSWLILTF